MDKNVVEALAEQAGVRFFGGWIEGSADSLYRFAELLVEYEPTGDPEYEQI